VTESPSLRVVVVVAPNSLPTAPVAAATVVVFTATNNISTLLGRKQSYSLFFTNKTYYQGMKIVKISKCPACHMVW